MEFSRYKNLFIVLTAATILTAGIAFVLSMVNKPVVSDNLAAVVAPQNIPSATLPVPPPPPQKLGNPPSIIKAVYVTGYSAGSSRYLNYLSNLFKNTEINAVVVDVKGSDGYVYYASGVADIKKYNIYSGAIKDIDSLVRFFHDRNIYVIGRIAVFQDPIYSKARPELAVYDKDKMAVSAGSEQLNLLQPVIWQDNKGLSWLDPASKEAWNYNVSLAKDVFYHGFDEVNFDYIRFPTDGKKENMGFPFWDEKTPKADVLKEFFNYTRHELAGEKISVDLFGQTTTNTDDMGIGQLLENAFENFDYISPMVYPSHYAVNFLNFANPADHPYEIIKYSMATALSREEIFLKQRQDLAAKSNQTPVSPASLNAATSALDTLPLAKFRPWLQDFDMGADYNADMVKQEIKATQDSLGESFNGFMLWNPSNIYTQEAILKPN
jgi:hypothetical protein